MRPRPLALTCALLTAALVSSIGSLQGREAGRKRLQGLVVVGDSVLAGVRSGGFVRRGQTEGAASLVARAAGVRLPRPAVASPGLPAPLVLVDDDRDGRLDPGEVRRSTARLGAPQGSRRRARNLAVPGESLTTVFEAIGRTELRAAAETDAVAAGRLYQKLRVLGDPGPGASVSQPSRVRDLAPGFALVWIGNDDLLDVAAGVLPDRRRLPPSQFGELFRRLLDEIAAAG